MSELMVFATGLALHVALPDRLDLSLAWSFLQTSVNFVLYPAVQLLCLVAAGSD